MSEDDKVYTGSVVWFNKGYGFLSWEIDGTLQTEIFCHYSDINADGFKTLQKDQKVSFKIGVNNHGKPKAICVTAIK